MCFDIGQLGLLGCGTVPTSPIGWCDRMVRSDGPIGPGPGNPSRTRFDIMHEYMAVLHP